MEQKQIIYLCFLTAKNKKGREAVRSFELMLPGVTFAPIIFFIPLRKFLLHNRNDAVVGFVLLRNLVFRVDLND